MKYAIAVQVIVEADSEADATDGIGEILRPVEHAGNVLDWRIRRVAAVTPDEVVAEAKAS